MREGDLGHVVFDRWKEVGALFVEIWGIAISCLRWRSRRYFGRAPFFLLEDE